VRKKIGVIGVAALISVLIFGVVPAQAGLLNVGGMAGYYNPNFGEVNDEYLEGFSKKFEGGLTYGLVLSYDISPNIRIRGEYNTFTSKTSETFTILLLPWDFEEKLTVTPIILSGIYRISPNVPLCPYIGAGVGSFSTKMEEKIDLLGITASYSDKDSPIGFQVLGGVEFGGGNFSLAAEARYIVAKAELNSDEAAFYTNVDLGGLFAGLIASIKF